jgi:hypothetical protein
MRGSASGDNNTAVGSSALGSSASGSRNTGIGGNTMSAVTGNDNASLGYFSGKLLTTGSQNTFIGVNADVLAASNSAVTNSTAIGYNAKVAADNSIQLGNSDVTNVKTSGTITAGVVTYPKTDGTSGQVLSTNGTGTLSWTTPTSGTVLAGYTESANRNVALGDATISNALGISNTAIGSYAMAHISQSSTNNVALGDQAARYTNQGDWSGNNQSMKESVVIGALARVNNLNTQNEIVIGYNARGTGSNTVRIGNANITAIGGQVAWTTASDIRLKKNIVNTNYGLNTVMKFRPVEYSLKSNNLKQIGFIAQEIKSLVPEVITGKEGDLEKGETLGITYSALVPVLTKAIQEQQALIEKLQNANDVNAEKIKKLTELVENLIKDKNK